VRTWIRRDDSNDPVGWEEALMSGTGVVSETASSAPPPDLPAPPDQHEWDDAAHEFLLSSLENVQSSAEVWGGALAALLGIFGTVALVAGPDEIAKVSDGLWQGVVVALIIAAGVCAGFALYLAAVAQMRPAPRSDNWNGSAYQVYVIRSSHRATTYLNWSRVLGLIGAVLLFTAGVVALVDAALS
jgi:hypothetical protein